MGDGIQAVWFRTTVPYTVPPDRFTLERAHCLDEAEASSRPMPRERRIEGASIGDPASPQAGEAVRRFVEDVRAFAASRTVIGVPVQLCGRMPAGTVCRPADGIDPLTMEPGEILTWLRGTREALQFTAADTAGPTSAPVSVDSETPGYSATPSPYVPGRAPPQR